jgi:hypothetical protein
VKALGMVWPSAALGCGTVGRASTLAPLPHLVGVVVGLRSEKQVVRPHTPGRAAVALVQNAWRGNGTVGQFPRYAMGQAPAVHSAPQGKPPVTMPVSVTRPNPARAKLANQDGASAVHSFPEPLSNGDGRVIAKPRAPLAAVSSARAPLERKLFAAVFAAAHDDRAHGVNSRGSGPGRVKASRGRFASTIP